MPYLPRSVSLRAFVLALGLSLAATGAQANVIRCQKVQASDACGTCEPELVSQTMAFLREIESGRLSPVNGQELLTELKRRMPVLFDNYVIMEGSESAQASVPHGPRILLKSPESDVIVGFSSLQTGPDGKAVAGYERIEFVIWDGPRARWDFIEVFFPSDLKFEERLAYLKENPKANARRPEIRYQPQLCQDCHGKFNQPYKPNWDAYYLWPGQLPMRQDLLVQGTDEVRRYEAFYKDDHKKNPRLRLLRVPNDVKPMLAGVDPETRLQMSELAGVASSAIFGSPKANEPFLWSNNTPSPGPRHGRGAPGRIHRIEHLGGQAFSRDNSGPGTILFNQLQAKNLCRIQHEISQSKLGEVKLGPKVRYAAAGAIHLLGGRFADQDKEHGCQNFQEFLPEWMLKNASEHYALTGESFVGFDRVKLPAITGKDYASLYASIYQDTRLRQRHHFTEKVARTHKIWEKYTSLKSEKQRKDEFKRFEDVVGILEREMTVAYLTKLRLLLEPLGVEMRNWSLSNEPDTFTFGDFFVNLQWRELDLWKSVADEFKREVGNDKKRAKEFCSWAAQKSRAALGEHPWPGFIDAGTRLGQPNLEQTRGALPQATTPREYRFPPSCIACHSDTGAQAAAATIGGSFSILPGPRIAFDDKEKLATQLRAANGQELLEQILDRVKRRPGEPGYMPMLSPPAPALKPQEIQEMEAELKRLRSP